MASSSKSLDLTVDRDDVVGEQDKKRFKPLRAIKRVFKHKKKSKDLRQSTGTLLSPEYDEPPSSANLAKSLSHESVFAKEGVANGSSDNAKIRAVLSVGDVSQVPIDRLKPTENVTSTDSMHKGHDVNHIVLSDETTIAENKSEGVNFDMNALTTDVTRLNNKLAYDKISVRPKRRPARNARGAQQTHIVRVEERPVAVNGFNEDDITGENKDPRSQSGGVSPKPAKATLPGLQVTSPTNDIARSSDTPIRAPRKSPIGAVPTGFVPSLQDVQAFKKRSKRTEESTESVVLKSAGTAGSAVAAKGERQDKTTKSPKLGKKPDKKSGEASPSVFSWKGKTKSPSSPRKAKTSDLPKDETKHKGIFSGLKTKKGTDKDSKSSPVLTAKAVFSGEKKEQTKKKDVGTNQVEDKSKAVHSDNREEQNESHRQKITAESHDKPVSKSEELSQTQLSPTRPDRVYFTAGKGMFDQLNSEITKKLKSKTSTVVESEGIAPTTQEEKPNSTTEIHDKIAKSPLNRIELVDKTDGSPTANSKETTDSKSGVLPNKPESISRAKKNIAHRLHQDVTEEKVQKNATSTAVATEVDLEKTDDEELEKSNVQITSSVDKSDPQSVKSEDPHSHSLSSSETATPEIRAETTTDLSIDNASPTQDDRAVDVNVTQDDKRSLIKIASTMTPTESPENLDAVTPKSESNDVQRDEYSEATRSALEISSHDKNTTDESEVPLQSEKSLANVADAITPKRNVDSTSAVESQKPKTSKSILASRNASGHSDPAESSEIATSESTSDSTSSVELFSKSMLRPVPRNPANRKSSSVKISPGNPVPKPLRPHSWNTRDNAPDLKRDGNVASPETAKPAFPLHSSPAKERPAVVKKPLSPVKGAKTLLLNPVDEDTGNSVVKLPEVEMKPAYKRLNEKPKTTSPVVVKPTTAHKLLSPVKSPKPLLSKKSADEDNDNSTVVKLSEGEPKPAYKRPSEKPKMTSPIAEKPTITQKPLSPVKSPQNTFSNESSVEDEKNPTAENKKLPVSRRSNINPTKSRPTNQKPTIAQKPSSPVKSPDIMLLAKKSTTEDAENNNVAEPQPPDVEAKPVLRRSQHDKQKQEESENTGTAEPAWIKIARRRSKNWETGPFRPKSSSNPTPSEPEAEKTHSPVLSVAPTKRRSVSSSTAEISSPKTSPVSPTWSTQLNRTSSIPSVVSSGPDNKSSSSQKDSPSKSNKPSWLALAMEKQKSWGAKEEMV